jgi:hypothetical protein
LDKCFFIKLELPKFQEIKIRNEVDRFGFSYFLAKKYNLSKTPRSFACFLHGWIWRKDLRLDDFSYSYIPLKTPIIVANSWQANFLKNSGFSTVVEGGLPFSYIPKSKNIKNIGSLLIMPPHSIKYYGIPYDFYINLIDYIQSIKHKYTEVYFCLHADDAKDEKIKELLQKRELKFIIGASASDANSLFRMRCIFDYFDYVTTIVMGSHILYAAFCGCKVSILKDHFFYYPDNALDHEHTMSKIIDYKERTLDLYNNKEKLMDQFPWLFVQHPSEAADMKKWAQTEIGVDNILEKEKLFMLLGWGLKGKSKAIIRIGLNKILKMLKF